MERGEFDDLPGAGKPIEDLGVEHDPDWWVKKLVERENIALLPPALAAAQGGRRARRPAGRARRRERGRREVEDFNERVIAARYRLPEGPPLITSRATSTRGGRVARASCGPAGRSARGRRGRREPAPPRRWWPRSR